jgi:CheY-like chemotaxis protein
MHSILIVEDDESIRLTLQEALEYEGHTVLTAANGLTGINLLKTIETPCLIFLDQMMPIMDGQSFLRAKALDDKIAAIPVIIMSATQDLSSRLGAVAFLKKPIDLDRLLELADQYCQKHTGAVR